MNAIIKWLYRTSVVIIILFFSCIGSFVLNFTFRWLSSLNNDCSTQNNVYQAIKTNADDWKTQFADKPIPTDRSINFLNTATRYYYAEIYAEYPLEKPILLYVITGTDRDGLSGSDGFFYLMPDQSIPTYWFENYWITQIDDDIYCYEIRGF